MTSTETTWAERIAEWRASGESAKEFSARIGFSVSTLHWWSSHLGRRTAKGLPASAETAPMPTLARVEVRRSDPPPAPTGGGVRVVIDGVHVELSAGFDPVMLRAVITALRAETR